MRLTPPQLEAGLQSLSATFHEDEWEGFQPYQKHSSRTQFQAWLAPCLLALPDGVTGDDLRAHEYYDLFIEIAGDFLLSKLRKNELFDRYTDEELKRRLSGEELEESAQYLTALTAILLDGVAGNSPATYVSVLENGFAEDTVPARVEDWDGAFRSLLGPRPND